MLHAFLKTLAIDDLSRTPVDKKDKEIRLIENEMTLLLNYKHSIFM
jgi:hypothetical protein